MNDGQLLTALHLEFCKQMTTDLCRIQTIYFIYIFPITYCPVEREAVTLETIYVILAINPM